jgi:hypothetical protein
MKRAGAAGIAGCVVGGGCVTAAVAKFDIMTMLTIQFICPSFRVLRLQFTCGSF